MIKSTKVTAANYDEVQEKLRLFYENERRLVQQHLAELFNVQPMTKDSSFEAKRVLNEVLAPIDALTLLRRKTKDWSDIVVFILASKMSAQTTHEWKKQIGLSNQTPLLERLRDFFNNLIHVLEAMEPADRVDLVTSASMQQKVPNSRNKFALSLTVHASETTSIQTKSKPFVKSTLCSKPHNLSNCETFVGKAGEDRKATVVTSQLCYNCLGTHQVHNCPSSRCRCDVSQKKHHTLLHVDRENQAKASTTPSNLENLIQTAPKVTNCTISETFTGVTGTPTSSATGFLLSSALIFVQNDKGQRVLV